MSKMLLRNDNLIEFEKSNGAFVAMSEVDGVVHIGFAWRNGQSPTNRFEDLAQFVWRERFPTTSFEKIRWYDFQRQYAGSQGNMNDHTAFKIVPVALEGYAIRKRFWGFLWGLLGTKVVKEPRRSDVKNVAYPRWSSGITFGSLPKEFQVEVKRNLIVPARNLDLI